MIQKKTLDVKGLYKVFAGSPLTLLPEARNRAGVTHPHHLLLG
jgi:hypothetical protein